jgi:hypothetical protein
VKALRLRAVGVHDHEAVRQDAIDIEQQQPDARGLFVEVRHVNVADSEA